MSERHAFGGAVGSFALFGCRCGSLRGRVASPAPRAVNRVTCFCDDCQAYAHHLRRADLLDARGGSDIVQVAPASLTFLQGHEHIAGLRLTLKGLHRWYARCCNTPMGNTLGFAIPFVGLMASIFDGAEADRLFGKPRGAILGQFAIGGAAPGTKGISLSLMGQAIVLVLGWKLRGQTWPHPFFDRATKDPIYPITVLAAGERERLRPLCGPKPAVNRPFG